MPTESPWPPGGFPEWLDQAKEVFDRNPAGDAFAEQFIRRHWSGPAFSVAQAKKADAFIKLEPAFFGRLREPTPQSIATLYAYAISLAKQAAVPGPNRGQLRAQLSAAIFVLYTVTAGGVGGGDPGLPDWGPRP